MRLEKENEPLQMTMPGYKELLEKVASANVKPISEPEMGKVWQSVFTLEINRIIELVAFKKSSTEVQFSLLRLYANYFNKSPFPESDPSSSITGKAMIFNLLRCHVETFEGNKDFLFKEENRFLRRKNSILTFFFSAKTRYSTSSSTSCSSRSCRSTTSSRSSSTSSS